MHARSSMFTFPGQKWASPGSRDTVDQFRDGWQAYNNAYLKNALYVPIFASLRCLGSLQYFHRTSGVYHVGQLVCQRHAQLSASQHPYWQTVYRSRNQWPYTTRQMQWYFLNRFVTVSVKISLYHFIQLQEIDDVGLGLHAQSRSAYIIQRVKSLSTVLGE